MATAGAQLRIFHDRRDAGQALAAAVKELGLEDPVVLGLPRGGVPVAYEVARALDAPLDVLVVRKIGAPGNPEFAIGAIAESGVRVLDHESLGALLISHEELEHAIARAQAEVDARVERYRAATPEVSVQGRTVVVVDDGLATGATARAAVRAVWTRAPHRVVLAVPVSSRQAVELLRPEVDEVVCVQVPDGMWAVGLWYESFGQTSDQEVIELLRRAAGASPDPSRQPPGADLPVRRSASVELAGGQALQGDLVVPENATGLVIFAHGSGSSRHSPRNRHVATILNADGLATLLIDLLTPGEERDRRNVFDIELLARRLVATTGWTHEQAELAALPVGYFGASTGAAAALWAAAEAGDRVRAVVSRGGRPDLAARRLHEVTAPVLLIVGGHDPLVLDLNRDALRSLRAPSDLTVVPGATHLFEEPGTLDEVARLATAWFTRHLEP